MILHLHYWIISFFICAIWLSKSSYYLSTKFSYFRSYLSLIKMVCYNNFLLDKIKFNSLNLLCYWLSWVFLKFLSYFAYKNFFFFHRFTFIISLLIMIALEAHISTLLYRMLRIISNTSINYSIISVDVILSSFLSN